MNKYIIGLVVIAIGVFIWDVYPTTPLPEKKSSISPTPTQKPYPVLTLPIIHPKTTIQFPTHTILAHTLAEHFLIFATKEKALVKVFKKNLQNDSQIELFEYSEDAEANTQSGNFYQGLNPSIALSPDGKFLAFTDTKGLELYNMTNATYHSLITKLTSPELPERPQWSVPMEDTFSLSLPQWSPTGRYISFIQGHYEGSSDALYDTETNNYIHGNGYEGQPIVAMSDSKFVLANNGMSKGLTVGSLFTLEGKNIAELFHQQDSDFTTATFSPDGKKIAFVYILPHMEVDNEYYIRLINKNVLAIAASDGTNFHIINKGYGNSIPLFSLDNTFLWFIEQSKDKSILVKYNLSTEKIETTIGLPDKFREWQTIGWTKEGYLTLIGGNHFIILDVKHTKILYNQFIENPYTTFAGFGH